MRTFPDWRDGSRRRGATSTGCRMRLEIYAIMLGSVVYDFPSGMLREFFFCNVEKAFLSCVRKLSTDGCWRPFFELIFCADLLL